jgi:hypothetical protein
MVFFQQNRHNQENIRKLSLHQGFTGIRKILPDNFDLVFTMKDGGGFDFRLKKLLSGDF